MCRDKPRSISLGSEGKCPGETIQGKIPNLRKFQIFRRVKLPKRCGISQLAGKEGGGGD